MEGGGPPAPSQQAGQADHDHGGHRHPRAQHGGQAGGQAPPVAAVDGPVVVGRQELHQPEGQSSGEADLEAPHDVLVARSEEQQEPGHQQRHPLVDPRSAHDQPQQGHHGQVRHHHRHHVGPVGVQVGQVEDAPPDQHGDGGQVLVVRSQQITRAGGAAGDQEVPLVEVEPAGAGHREDQHGSGHQQGHQQHGGRRMLGDRLLVPAGPLGRRCAHMRPWSTATRIQGMTSSSMSSSEVVASKPSTRSPCRWPGTRRCTSWSKGSSET